MCFIENNTHYKKKTQKKHMIHFKHTQKHEEFAIDPFTN